MSNFNIWTGPSGLQYYSENDVKWLWAFLQNKGLSNNAMAGLFGNLYQESHCCPFELEGWETQYDRCWDYTCQYIRTASQSAFGNQRYAGGKGFGLAQWTTYDRKTALWRYAPTLGGVVKDHTWLGDMERDANYLYIDLSTWDMRRSNNENIWSAQGKTVWQWLTDPNVSISDAVNAVLMLYEIPFESAATHAQWQREYDVRMNYANKTHVDFTGSTPPPQPDPPPTPTPTPDPPPSGAKLPIWLYFKMKEMNNNGSK